MKARGNTRLSIINAMANRSLCRVRPAADPCAALRSPTMAEGIVQAQGVWLTTVPGAWRPAADPCAALRSPTMAEGIVEALRFTHGDELLQAYAKQKPSAFLLRALLKEELAISPVAGLKKQKP